MSPSVSLLALRAFAEVGRHGSVKRAAAAIGVTPGAVSQQIKLLELRLGVTLLERRNREVRLTAEGLRLFEPLSAGFQQIADAVGLFDGGSPDRDSLTVSTTPSLAASWLVPRLGRFSLRHPNINIRIDTTPKMVDLRTEGIDVALRHGSGDYPGLEAIRIFVPRLICVANPALLAEGPPMNEPSDCLLYPRLQDRDRTVWSKWFRECDVDGADKHAQSGPCFENDLLLIRAAVAGQGLALVRDLYAHEELSAGRIVCALKDSLPTTDAYYFVARPETMKIAKVSAFRRWIFEEMADLAKP